MIKKKGPNSDILVITAFSAFGTPYEVSCLKPTGQILILSNFNIQNLKIILEFCIYVFTVFKKIDFPDLKNRTD